jgi:hypothetical protein
MAGLLLASAALWIFLQPGLFFSQAVDVPLPAGIGAGRFPVLAGLYSAGAADMPLTAAGLETPRVPLGTLEVRD